MIRLSNPTAGPKGVWVSGIDALFNGKTVWVEPGEVVEVAALTKAEQEAFEASGGVVERVEKKDPMDHDNDGRKGGSAPPVESARPRGRPRKDA